MSTISHASRRTGSQVFFCLALLLMIPQVGLDTVFGATLRTPASSIPVQNKVTVVGILPFQDESDTGAPDELGKKIAQQLKQRLSLNFKDVLPKLLNSQSPASLTVEQVVALGKQNSVQFVVRGGILALAASESNVTAQLYAEIINVESGAVNVVRAEGTGPSGSIKWSEIDLNSASFSSSAAGTALTQAIDSLATSIHQALLTPTVEASSGQTSTSDAQTAETTPPADAAAADADEELRQLIAQAEEIVASGTGDSDLLKSISSGLEKLKAALVSKASVIESGGDPAASDQEIAAAKTEMQTALTALSEQAASAAANSEEVAAPSGEKKGLLGAIDQRATEALGLLQKIQELRAAFRGVKEGTAQGDAVAETSEQPTEDVSGVVMQAGKPLAGVEVSVKNSNVTAITGPDGSYTLKSLPAGKLSNLVLKKDGKQIATGQVDLLRGRSLVADFEVKSNMSPNASALRIIPSATVLKGTSKAGTTGTLKGTARDQTGKPLGRALVSLQLAAAADTSRATALLHKALVNNEAPVARTDSQGIYRFFNIPAGEYLVTVKKSGLSPISTRVTVKANTATEVQSRLTSIPRTTAQNRTRTNAGGSSSLPPGGPNPIVVLRDRALNGITGSTQPRGGSLRGQVVDASNRKPIAGAIVLIAGRRARTDQAGNYEFADLAPGKYLTRVTSDGFSEDQQSITIRAGVSSREEFSLKRLGDSNRTARLLPETPKVIAQIRLGQVRGRVVDAASGAPIAGAVVAIRVSQESQQAEMVVIA